MPRAPVPAAAVAARTMPCGARSRCGNGWKRRSAKIAQYQPRLGLGQCEAVGGVPNTNWVFVAKGPVVRVMYGGAAKLTDQCQLLMLRNDRCTRAVCLLLVLVLALLAQRRPHVRGMWKLANNV